MKKICLIRHGESLLNQINQSKYSMFSGQFDCPLSEKGKVEATRMGKNFTLEFDVVYVSDALRARETLIYSQPIASKIIITNSLRERSLGIFEGTDVDMFLNNKRYKDYWPGGIKGDFKHSFTTKAPGGENYSDVCNRLTKILTEIEQMDDGSRIAIYSHQSTLRCLLFKLNIIDKSEVFTNKIQNCYPILIEM